MRLFILLLALLASSTSLAEPQLLNELRGPIQQDLGGRAMGLVGVASMIAIAFAFSINRRAVPWRLVGIGTALQLVFALLVLKTKPGRDVFSKANDIITDLLAYSEVGSRFLFGNLADNKIPVGTAISPLLDDPRVVSLENIGALFASTGSMIAFRVLPTIIFFSALTAILYHLGILQRVVKVLAIIMAKTMGTSGAESLSTSANIFLGQTEAPLLVRPFLAKMTTSELCCIMTGGFATVAGGVMAAYVGMLGGAFPDIAGHLLAASVMAAPATLVMSKIIVPETETPETLGKMELPDEELDANVIDAAARGTSEGLMLTLNVAAMLIGFLALLAMLNGVLGGIAGLFGYPELRLETLFGVAGAPLAFLLGTPWEDCRVVGEMLGTKTVLNEFVAYMQLAAHMQAGTIVHGKSVVIASYALCGFANFGSIGIQIGGLAALAPSRRADLARVGLRAMIAGSLASFQTAAIAAMVL